MLYHRLVELIEKNADDLTKRWIKEIRSNQQTPTYAEFDEQQLYEGTYSVYSELGKWIGKETTKQDVEQHYTSIGRQFRKEGLALSEVIQAMVLIKRHLWLKVLRDGLLDTVIDLHSALELNNRVVLFFDRAIYFSTIGYETAGK
ncbi:MAG: RsbRD N-terminal domain-containing protein [Candidatus Alcyoniella australis]|nr:RsbRD N-terminal domain-containing protein [Candidatus Alcyoniella australis]